MTAANPFTAVILLAATIAAGVFLPPRIAQGQEERDAADAIRVYPDPTVEDRTADEPRGRVARRNETAEQGEGPPRGGQGIQGLRAPDVGLWFRRGTGNTLIVDAVAGSGAIAQFGLREGDRIVSVHGQKVTSERDFLNVLLDEKLRSYRVPVVVIRDARRRLVYVRPETLVREASEPVVDPLDRLGVVLDDRYVDRLVVWRVLPRSPAYYAGLRSGDVIYSFDGARTVDVGDLVRLLEDAEAPDIAIGIRRNQDDAELVVDLGQAAAVEEDALPPPLPRNETFDDIRPDPYSDRRLSPRPDVPPGMRVPGGEVGRERGPIAPATTGPTPTTPMRTGFPR